MHLSKVKHSKFNESGQLLIFYAASAAWGLDIIVRVTLHISLIRQYPNALFSVSSISLSSHLSENMKLIFLVL